MSNSVTPKLWAKVTRAETHIEDFQRGLEAFFDTQPYGVANGIVSKVDPPPDTLTAIAADIIQNLRSVLDNLAYQLVLDARSGTKPDWNVYFPITSCVAFHEARRNGSIKGVRQEVIDAIDAIEPYKDGKGHKLWQLSELSNIDKHELLLRAGAYFRNVDVSGDFERQFRSMPGFEGVKVRPILLRPADQLLPMKVGDTLFIGPSDSNRRFTFELSFHAPGVIDCEPAIQTLRDMNNLVRSIIRGFESFFL